MAQENDQQRAAARVNRLGQWNASAGAQKNPSPDGRWWPLKWDAGHSVAFADVARTHPCVYGVWKEINGTYTVAVKAEALRARKKHEKGREGDHDSAWLVGGQEVKRRGRS